MSSLHMHRSRWLRGAWLLVLALFGTRSARAQGAVADSAAVRHPQEQVTVEGQVHDVHVSARGQVTYLNFGGAFPNITFTVHIPDSVAARLADPAALAGRRVRVSGRIWMQDDRWPAITVTDTAQLHRME